MNYIYDIHLNFNKTYFDFYEWKKEDDILNIRKIPIVRVNSDTFKEIISNRVKIDIEELKQIENKTEIENRNYKLNCLIVTDAKNICALRFDKQGITMMFSSFNLNDEYNILYTSKKMKETEFKYNKLKKLKYITETRLENTQKQFLLRHITTLPFDTLKYIYYECFNKEENNYSTMIKTIITEINNNNFVLNNKIYNILNPISTN